MSLSSTLNIAQSSLATNSALSSILSRNIAGVNNPNYSLKTGEVITGSNGASLFVGVTQASNTALFGNLLTANSDSASSQALADGLNQLEQTISLSGAASPSSSAVSTASSVNDISPASAIGTLVTALQTYAAAPSDTASAQSALNSAQNVVTTLNNASATVQTVRQQADQAIATSVASVNSLLQQFGTVNTQIIQGTASGQDVTDAMDTRNGILNSLSKEMGITTASLPNGGMALYTDGGVTLFQDSARTVSFSPTASFAAGSSGAAVMVDGVPVTGASAVMDLRSGKIAGLAQLRDVSTVAYQQQLDQIAGGLIDASAETNTSGGTSMTVAGLFTVAGGVTLPASGQTGLAATIKVNASVDPAQGGTLTLLRDGGIGGGTSATTVNGNASGGAGYSGYITGLVDSLTANRSFDPTSGGTPVGSLATYAASSVSWVEAQRQTATSAANDRSAVVSQTTASLSNATGVNLDDQLSRLLDIEHSYQASAQLITTVKNMLDSLLTAVQ